MIRTDGIPEENVAAIRREHREAAGGGMLPDPEDTARRLGP